MAKDEKAAASKPIVDVAKPGKTAPSVTSKPVLVTNRPILKDPMMVDEEASTDDAAATAPPLPSGAKATIKPLEKSEKTEPAKAKAVAEAEPEATDSNDVAEVAEPKESSEEVPAEANKADAKKDSTQQTAEEIDAEEVEKIAKHDAEVTSLIDSKKYFLPINSVEKRKTKRFVVLGAVLSLFLLVAWVDVALDAGLVSANTNFHTHFFSSSTAEPTVKLPTNKVYISPVDKTSFSYPSSWQIEKNKSTTDETVSVSAPQTELDANLTGATAIFMRNPDVNTDTNRVTIPSVTYTKLKTTSNGKPLYLRELVQQASTGYIVRQDVVDNQGVTDGETLTVSNLNNGAFFNAPDGKTVLMFNGTVFGGGTAGAVHNFATVEDAQAFMKNNHTYQSLKQTLLSLRLSQQ